MAASLEAQISQQRENLTAAARDARDRVVARKLSQAQADYLIERQTAILDTLLWLQANRETVLAVKQQETANAP